jgi:hypothetical protein
VTGKCNANTGIDEHEGVQRYGAGALDKRHSTVQVQTNAVSPSNCHTSSARAGSSLYTAPWGDDVHLRLALRPARETLRVAAMANKCELIDACSDMRRTAR